MKQWVFGLVRFLASVIVIVPCSTIATSLTCKPKPANPEVLKRDHLMSALGDWPHGLSRVHRWTQTSFVAQLPQTGSL
jgi:hypothetical protein